MMAHKDFSIDVSTPSLLLFLINSPDLATNPTISSAHDWTIGFNTSNMVIQKRLSHWHHIQQEVEYDANVIINGFMNIK